MYNFLTLIWGIWDQTAQIFSMPQILYNWWPSNDLEATWARRCFMQNIKLKSLFYLYAYFPMNWGIWAQFFQNCPTVMFLIPSSVYNSLLELPLGLNRTLANLIRNLSWKIWITFFVSLTMINLGHWIHIYSESQKILLFFLAFSRWPIRQTWRLEKYEDFRKSSYTSVYIFSYICTWNKKLM